MVTELNPGAFKTLAIILTEYGYSSFKPYQLADNLDCHPRTVERRIRPLQENGIVFETGKSFQVREDSDLTPLDKLVDKSVDKSVKPSQGSSKGVSEDNKNPLDKSVDKTVDKSVKPQKVPPETKTKNPSHSKKQKTQSPQKSPPKNPATAGTKKSPKKPPSEFEDLDNFVEHVLDLYNFNPDFGTVSKITMRLLSSKLQENHYEDYLTNQLQDLDGRVQEGDLSRSKATRYIGSTKSVQWYLEDIQGGKSSKQSQKNAYINVGKNNYDSEVQTPDTEPDDNGVPNFSPEELKHERIEAREAGFDPDNFEQLRPEAHGYTDHMLKNVNPKPPEKNE